MLRRMMIPAASILAVTGALALGACESNASSAPTDDEILDAVDADIAERENSTSGDSGGVEPGSLEPEEAMKGWIEALNAKDVTSALFFTCDEPTGRAYNYVDALVEGNLVHGDLLGAEEFFYSEQSNDGQTAEVLFGADKNDASNHELGMFTLIVVDGKWKVCAGPEKY